MRDLLAVIGAPNQDEQLLRQIASWRPSRVTVLLQDGSADWADADSGAARATRDRLARLLHEVERRTGAVVVGLAGDRSQLQGWRFDRIVGGQTRLAVAA